MLAEKTLHSPSWGRSQPSILDTCSSSHTTVQGFRSVRHDQYLLANRDISESCKTEREKNVRGAKEHTKKAHEPINVDSVDAYAKAGFSAANPSAPQRVKPRAPTRFHTPICQPREERFGRYHFVWTSSMKSQLDIMKPLPPMTLFSS